MEGCVKLPRGWQWHNMFSVVVFVVVVVGVAVVCFECADPWWMSDEPTIAVQRSRQSKQKIVEWNEGAKEERQNREGNREKIKLKLILYTWTFRRLCPVLLIVVFEYSHLRG